MPTARHMADSAVYQGKIYVIGGENIMIATRYLDTNEQYDPVMDIWISMAPMPTGRGGLVVETVGDKIYAIGGWPGEGDSNVNEAYTPPINSYLFLPVLLGDPN